MDLEDIEYQRRLLRKKLNRALCCFFVASAIGVASCIIMGCNIYFMIKG